MQIKIFRQSCLEPHVRWRNSVFCCQSDGHLKVVVLIRQSCVMARCHNLRQCKLNFVGHIGQKYLPFPHCLQTEKPHQLQIVLPWSCVNAEKVPSRYLPPSSSAQWLVRHALAEDYRPVLEMFSGWTKSYEKGVICQ